VASNGHLPAAIAAFGALKQGINPAAGHVGEVTWRTAQYLAMAGGDGFDTLLKVGAVRKDDGTPSLPGERDPLWQRRQEALRVTLEASAQSGEGAADRSVRAARMAHLATRAAVKLWVNHEAGQIGPDSLTPADQRLTRAEKNAYYEWTQNFGRPGAKGMLPKTKERLHKLVTAHMERAQRRGFGKVPTWPAWDIRGVFGKGKSPMTALQFGTRGSQLRTPEELRDQYDVLLRTMLRELERHFTEKVPESRDFHSLSRNLVDREFLRYWCEQAGERGSDGSHVRRPLEAVWDRATRARILQRVTDILGSPNGTDPLAPALRELVPADAAAELNRDGAWVARLPNGNSRLNLRHVDKLVREERIGANVMSDDLLAEFGLNAENRRNLPAWMSRYRLFGNDGTRLPTVQHFLDRAHNIRNNNDELKPVVGADGSVIKALKEFNDTYIREEPMGPRVRAQDGGVYGLNNVGETLNMFGISVAPNPWFSVDKRAFFEYNSGGHAFEVAFGKQTTVGAGLGVSIGHGIVTPAGVLLSGSVTVGVGFDWANQNAVRLRGRRELNERGEALFVADAPGDPAHHGRQIDAARNRAGEPLLVDQAGRRATTAAGTEGSTHYIYEDNGQVVTKRADGTFTDEMDMPLLDRDNRPAKIQFEKAYDFADNGARADGFARMDKARFHLMQATDFIFEMATQARTRRITQEQLWDAWVDRFFDNPDVSVSYQHHRNFGNTVSGQLSGSVRVVTDLNARPGIGASIGYNARPYEALNRADQTGRINRTIVQIGYGGFGTMGISASVGTPPLSDPSDIPSAGGLPVKVGGVSATMGDTGVLAGFRMVEADGKIIPEFTYIDIEYRTFDLYKKYVEKNRGVWEAFYGKENLEKHLEKLEMDSQPNQRFTERWRLSPDGVHRLRSYLALSRIHQTAARRQAETAASERQKIEAEEITKFAAEMLEDRSLWDPLGAFVVEVNSKERAVGANFFVQAQKVTRSAADVELDWIGGSSAGMNEAARLRYEATHARIVAEMDAMARHYGEFLAVDFGFDFNTLMRADERVRSFLPTQLFEAIGDDRREHAEAE
jgi:hypothetical protein